jgi:hypothetical protein
MPPAAAIGGGVLAGIGGGLIQANATRQAAGIQSGAAQKSNELLSQMYDQAKGYQQPYLGAGTDALSKMQDADFQRDFTAADFQQDPGLDFRMQEGQKALERSAASKGGLQSGGTMKALAQYGQNFGSNEYQNAYNRFNSDRDRRYGRLGQIAGMGQSAANSLGNLGMGYASNYGNNLMGAANAQAGAKLSNGQMWGGMLSGMGSQAAGYGMMGAMSPSPSPGGGGGSMGGGAGGGGAYSLGAMSPNAFNAGSMPLMAGI